MIKVRILSPQWSREFDADAVFLPGALGEFEILKDHAPIISLLEAGEIKWRIDSRMERLKIGGGVAKLDRNDLTVCVEE